MSPEVHSTTAGGRVIFPSACTIVELWELLKDHEDPLYVMLYTKDASFDYEPIRVWWTHGDPGKFGSEAELSQIIFDIPDEAWRRMQSIYATKFKRRFFGSTDKADMPKAIRTKTNDERNMSPQPFSGAGIVDEVFTTEDWPRLKRAIEATALSSTIPNGMTYKEIMLHGGIFGEARIIDDRLEINIDTAIDQAVKNWQAAIRRKLGFPN